MNTPSDMRHDGGLSAGEAYRLGWALVFPVVLLNILFWQLENILEVSGWAAMAMQAANVMLAVFVFLPKAIRQAIQAEFPRFHLAIRRPETAHGAGRESPSVATVKRRSGAVLGLSLLDQPTKATFDPSRSMKYRESLRLSVQVAIFTAGLAAVPLGWLRELLAAGQNPGQIILKVPFVIAFLSLPVWAAWALLLDFSKTFSLRIVREDSIEAQEA